MYPKNSPSKLSSALKFLSAPAVVAAVIMVLVSGGGLALIVAATKQPALKPAATASKSISSPNINTKSAVPASTPTSTPPPAPQPPNSSTHKAIQPPASTKSTPPAPTPVPPNCTKPTGFTVADGLSISTSSPGLKQSIDPPNYYTVYGYTASTIRSQLNQCSPVSSQGGGEFDADTTWWVNFNYLYAPSSGGNCYVYSPVVGLHVKRILPSWQATAYDAPGLDAQWQNFINNLNNHENGHVALAQQYATDLLNTLQSLSQSSCSTIVATTNALGTSKINALNQAEANYDAQTNHGATQGATFP